MKKRRDWRESKVADLVDYSRANKLVLVALAINGDQEAFSELVVREKNKVYLRVLRLCNNTAIAQDLAQTTFIEAWKSIGKLKIANAFDSWLRRISVYVWLQHCKKFSSSEIVNTEIVEHRSVANEFDEEIFRKLDLDFALTKLKPSERLHVVLSYHEGLSHREIAKLTGHPLGTVKSNILRGTDKLRIILEVYKKT